MSESGMSQAMTTSQIIHARVRAQTTRIRIVCASEKPSSRPPTPAPGRRGQSPIKYAMGRGPQLLPRRTISSKARPARSRGSS
jgi:hypothetical protein